VIWAPSFMLITMKAVTLTILLPHSFAIFDYEFFGNLM
jgi:hypothetical protein